jgi:SSS family solute:Na+ symporter
MWILSYIRQGANVGLLFGALACFAVANMPRFFDISTQLTDTLGKIDNSLVRTEMAVPIFLSLILPPFVKALFVAGMISAAISTLDTYFLSWSGILVQDVISPLSKKDISPEKRLRMLKWAVAGVALFVYAFSLWWKPTDFIWMYFAITASIYTGGAGAVILGALYWRKGTTEGAWSSMITGSSLAIGSIFIRQAFVARPWWPGWLDGMVLSVASSLVAIAVFIIVSLITHKQDYDLESLLNRDNPIEPHPKALNKRFTIEAVVSAIVAIIVVLTIIAFWYNRTHDVDPEKWVTFWKWYTYVVYGYSIPVAIWFLLGSVKDLKTLLLKLRDTGGE